MRLNTPKYHSPSETEHTNFEHFTLLIWNSTHKFTLSIWNWTQQFHSLSLKLNTETLSISLSQSETVNKIISFSQSQKSTHNHFTLSMWNWTMKFWIFHPLSLKQHTQQFNSLSVKQYTQQFHSLDLKTKTAIWTSQFQTEHTTILLTQSETVHTVTNLNLLIWSWTHNCSVAITVLLRVTAQKRTKKIYTLSIQDIQQFYTRNRTYNNFNISVVLGYMTYTELQQKSQERKKEVKQRTVTELDLGF